MQLREKMACGSDLLVTYGATYMYFLLTD